MLGMTLINPLLFEFVIWPKIENCFGNFVTTWPLDAAYIYRSAYLLRAPNNQGITVNYISNF